MLNRANERLFLIFKRSFANALNPLVRINLNENPVRSEAINDKGFNIRNLHFLPLFIAFFFIDEFLY
jgi:hypothetical protein